MLLSRVRRKQLCHLSRRAAPLLPNWTQPFEMSQVSHADVRDVHFAVGVNSTSIPDPKANKPLHVSRRVLQKLPLTSQGGWRFSVPRLQRISQRFFAVRWEPRAGTDLPPRNNYCGKMLAALTFSTPTSKRKKYTRINKEGKLLLSYSSLCSTGSWFVLMFYHCAPWASGFQEKKRSRTEPNLSLPSWVLKLVMVRHSCPEHFCSYSSKEKRKDCYKGSEELSICREFRTARYKNDRLFRRQRFYQHIFIQILSYSKKGSWQIVLPPTPTSLDMQVIDPVVSDNWKTLEGTLKYWPFFKSNFIFYYFLSFNTFH